MHLLTGGSDDPWLVAASRTSEKGSDLNYISIIYHAPCTRYIGGVGVLFCAFRVACKGQWCLYN